MFDDACTVSGLQLSENAILTSSKYEPLLFVLDAGVLQVIDVTQPSAPIFSKVDVNLDNAMVELAVNASLRLD